MRTPSVLPIAALSLALLAHTSVLHAATVSFDEFPPANDASLLGEQYADLGLHFVPGDDGSVWAGISGGDPGKWGLEGTNGTAFVGFNGPSYELVALFDVPIQAVALDVSGGKGSSLDDTFTLMGFLDGAQVEAVTVTLEGLNVWQTVELTETVDEIQLFGEGVAFHPYAIDNLVWTNADVGGGIPEEEQPPEEELVVAIDIEPWSRWSGWWLSRWTPVFVVMYGSDSFDVESVDPESLELGPNAATASHHMFYWDANRDGQLDLIARFGARDTGLSQSDDEACVTGETTDGLAFTGCDTREVDTWKRERRHDRRHHRRDRR